MNYADERNLTINLRIRVLKTAIFILGTSDYVDHYDVFFFGVNIKAVWYYLNLWKIPNVLLKIKTGDTAYISRLVSNTM